MLYPIENIAIVLPVNNFTTILCLQIYYQIYLTNHHYSILFYLSPFFVFIYQTQMGCCVQTPLKENNSYQNRYGHQYGFIGHSPVTHNPTPHSGPIYHLNPTQPQNHITHIHPTNNNHKKPNNLPKLNPTKPIPSNKIKYNSKNKSKNNSDSQHSQGYSPQNDYEIPQQEYQDNNFQENDYYNQNNHSHNNCNRHQQPGHHSMHNHNQHQHYDHNHHNYDSYHQPNHTQHHHHATSSNDHHHHQPSYDIPDHGTANTCGGNHNYGAPDTGITNFDHGGGDTNGYDY